ncbi:MurR/RpiR family transcriptional regulator [Faecalispora anaeroviscerum]|uniref:MurR/RpiR family transcriptional regulator n=1 Tax=Faecalispora anaeroviscerum TaxID=2991836 RepID=UPI0024BAA115|nr:MurR/RpiR family transcriptional regulator [Faecalispora anaeroviscerum]
MTNRRIIFKETTDMEPMQAFITKLSATAKESATYEKLAYYIEKNVMRIIFMTAADVALEAKVSQGSVSRFCMALGYNGYNDFQRELQKFVSERITGPQRLNYASKDRQSAVGDILASEVNNLVELEASIGGSAYEALVDTIANAKNLILLSSRMSATLLPYMQYILNKLRNNVYMVTQETPAWNTLEYRDPIETEIVLPIFPRYPAALLKKAQVLKQNGFRITAITDSRLSPICQIADETNVVPITVASVFDIYSTPMVFLNLVFRDAAKKMPNVASRLEQIELQETRSGVYYPSGR